VKYKVGDKVDYIGVGYGTANAVDGTVKEIDNQHLFPYKVDFNNGYIQPCYEEELILHKKTK
jgi:hypothetical protein